MFSIIKLLGGNFSQSTEVSSLSEKAQALVHQSFEDIPGREVRDYHVHLAGIGTGNSGCYIHPKMQSLFSITHYLRAAIFLSASGVKDKSMADQEYLSRLVALARGFPGRVKLGILALDKYCKDSGEPDWRKTLLYVPNEYVVQTAKAFPDLFIPVISVHPYRPDALDELEKWAGAGVRMVKWLPNSMNIDPSDKKCLPFYERLVDYKMTLLIHAGKENALKIPGLQHLGNPLLLRNPLNMGVNIIAAHFASLGVNPDIESKSKKPVRNYQLMLRLMKDKNYASYLFCDIAAITQINRDGRPMELLLNSEELQNRLINGSDYPLPGVNMAISTYYLMMRGFINGSQRKLLNEIYAINPLLFDYVLKRAIKSRKAGSQFSAQVFTPKSFID